MQKYVRPDRKTRRQMEIVIVGVCMGHGEKGERDSEWEACAWHLIDVDVKNCVACGSTQNTKVVNVIAKCGTLGNISKCGRKTKKKTRN